MSKVDWTAIKTQKQWKEELQHLLRTNKKALYRAVVVIYDYQTEYEKADYQTKEANGVGFSAFDAEYLSSIAEQIKQGRVLTPKQLAITTNKMIHYWRQLMVISKRRMSTNE